MDTTVTQHQKRDQESNNTSFNTVQNNKHPTAEEERNAVRNKLKEDLQIMWHKVRLLKMSQREKLPKLEKKKKHKTDKASGRNNGIIEELLEEDEMDITDTNNLIYTTCSHIL
jgi:type II secretory pathway component PulC